MRAKNDESLSVILLLALTVTSCPASWGEPPAPHPESAQAAPAPESAATQQVKAAQVPLPPKASIDVSRPYGSHLQPILQKIKANAEQRQKITVIVQSYRSKIEPLRQDYRIKNQDFLASLINGCSSETVMAKQVEVGHLSSDISSKYCLMRLEIRRLLAPDQIVLYEEYIRQQGWSAR